jgi:hypothetical protein
MKLSLLQCIILTFALCSTPSLTLLAQEDAPQKQRTYKHDFEGQDLTDRDFSSKNLDDANFEDCNLTRTNFKGASLKNCNFKGTRLEGTDFSKADLTGSDFRTATFQYPYFTEGIFNKADFTEVDFNHAFTHDAKFREAKMRGIKNLNQIYGSDYYKADFRGADLSTVALASNTIFRKAQYDQFTRWFKGFDVEASGAVFVETKEEEMEKPKKKPKTEEGDEGSEDGEAKFQKLDKNEDGVLSGSEMKGLKDKDANDDGEITLSEFLNDA